MRHDCIQIHVNYKEAGAIQDGYQPLLYTYLLDKRQELVMQQERPAVIICAGGCYRFKSPREEEPIAMRFLASGIHAFVLQYSVAPSRFPSAMLELAAAVKLVKENAKSWGISRDCILVAGFSAGGHLCASLGTLWDEPVFERALDSDVKSNWRPSGMILCYPVITMMEPYLHEESRNCLLGYSASKVLIEQLSLETRVKNNTVPAFLWHTYEDQLVPIENTLQFATALRKSQVPFELHIYEMGCHGLALCDETTANSISTLLPSNANWIELAVNWAKRLNLNSSL